MTWQTTGGGYGNRELLQSIQVSHGVADHSEGSWNRELVQSTQMTHGVADHSEGVLKP